MAKATTMDIIEMTVADAAKIIRHTDSTVPIMLTGQPGIAKTSVIKAESKAAGAILSVHNLSQMEPTDLLGVPHPEGKVSIYKVPYFWYQASTEIPDGPPMWLFFDDVVTASEQLQSCLYSWVLERGNDQITLRDNVRFLFAGNRVEDNSAANPMPKALANRMMHLNIKVDVDVWLAWAKRNKIHPWIVGYIRTHQDKINTFDPNSADVAFATPRSYEMLSKALTSLQGINNDGPIANDLAIMSKVAHGIVGSVSVEFYAWVKHFERCIPPEEIIANPKECKVPAERDLDILHATVASLEHYIKSHPKQWKPALIYAQRLVTEMAIILMSQIVEIVSEDLDDKNKMEAFGSPEFQKGFAKYAKYLQQ